MGGGARAPGLNSVRALAVLAVIAFHEQFAAFHGGFLGVDVFFVLSGYLITDLLAAHWARHGRLDLRGFWIRRARRLLPALAVVLVTVTAAVAVIEPGQLGALRQALLAAVSYSSNWWQALQHQSYFAGFGPPPPLRHLWSLAIEEQFYLVWPLILIVTLRTCQRRRLRGAVALAGAALSAVAMAAIYVPGGDPSPVYLARTPTRLRLFIGAALAFAWPLRQLRAAPRQHARRADAAGLAGIAVLAWAMSRYSGGDAALYPAGLLIAALGPRPGRGSRRPGLIAGLLSWAPLRWAGRAVIRHLPMALASHRDRSRDHRAATPGPLAVCRRGRHRDHTGRRHLEMDRRANPAQRPPGHLPGRLPSAWQLGHDWAASRSPVRAVPVLWVAVALTVTCTAAYGVFHASSGPSGMEKQIIIGERVSAVTRADASRSAYRPAAKPSPSPTQRKVLGQAGHRDR